MKYYQKIVVHKCITSVKKTKHCSETNADSGFDPVSEIRKRLLSLMNADNTFLLRVGRIYQTFAAQIQLHFPPIHAILLTEKGGESCEYDVRPFSAEYGAECCL